MALGGMTYIPSSMTIGSGFRVILRLFKTGLVLLRGGVEFMKHAAVMV
jgi:hypothetical protein